MRAIDTVSPRTRVCLHRGTQSKPTRWPAWSLLVLVVGLVGCDASARDAGDRSAETTGPTERTEPAGPSEPTDRTEPADPSIEAAPSEVEPSFAEDAGCFGIEPVDLAPEEVRCGYVEVPLDHDDPDGGSIDLAVAVLGSEEQPADTTPLLLLGGGPGEVMIEPHLTLPRVRQLFDVGRRTIVVDQRGVGSSDPALECAELTALEALETTEAEIDAALDALQDCRDRLAADGVDLDAFNHLANARDVDLVRRALGHDAIDLRGASYGTQVALLAAQMFPETTRSVILSSPVDPRGNWIDGVAAGFDRALDQLVRACASDHACSDEVGDLQAAIQDTADRLEGQPEEVTVQTPGGGEVTTTFTPSRFVGSLFMLFYQAELASLLPAFVDHAHDGDLRPLAFVAALFEQQLEGAVSTGMQLSMVCSGEGALANPEAALAELDAQLLEEHWYDANLLGGPIDAACDVWDVELAYDPAQVTLDNEVPTLIVTGGLDHVTPPSLGQQVHDALPASHLIEVAGAAHAPLETLTVVGSCGRSIVAAFLDEPDQAPDATCASSVELQVRTELPPGLG